MVVNDLVASRSRRTLARFSTRHVITIYFRSVDVGNDTVAILELHLDGSHSRNTSELLAEVLRSRRRSRSHTQSNFRPSTVSEVVVSPVSSVVVRELPDSVLVDRRVQREGNILLSP